jgi:selenocysteine lyase/cysteine desulfurase
LANSAALFGGLEQIPGIRLVSRVDLPRRSGIVSFASSTMGANALHAALMRAGVSCAVRDDAIRLSPHFYQGEKEIGKVLAAVQLCIHSPVAD